MISFSLAPLNTIPPAKWSFVKLQEITMSFVNVSIVLGASNYASVEKFLLLLSTTFTIIITNQLAG